MKAGRTQALRLSKTEIVIPTRCWVVNGGVLALFLVLTVWLSYPLISHFTTAVPGPPGDNFDFLWELAWFKRALFDTRLSPFHTDTLYYPFGYDLALGPITLAQVILSLPLAMVGGQILGYNTTCVLSFVLAGFGTYLLVYKLTGSRVAGVAGGVVFGFCSARVKALIDGHFNVLGTMWLPYVVLCLELMLHDRGTRRGIAGGIFCALTIFSSWYNVPLLGAILISYVLCQARAWRGLVQSRGFRTTLLGFFGILLLSVVVSLALTRPLWREGTEMQAYSLAYVDYKSPSLDYFVVPHAVRTLLGRPPVSPDIYVSSLSVYVGSLSIVLAVLGLLVRRGRVTRVFVWIGVLSLLLALGPRLRWGGETVRIFVPAEVERVFNAGMSILATRLAPSPIPSYYTLHWPGTVYIPMPVLALQLFVPWLRKMRYWFRFVITLCLALAVLAGIGVAHLESRMQHMFPRPLSRARKTRREAARLVLGPALVVGLFLELMVLPQHMGYSEVRPQAVDLWLAEQQGDFAIVELPYTAGGPRSNVYRTLFHGKKSCSGPPPFAPEDHQRAIPLLYAFPSTATIELLKSWAPQYVLIEAREYAERYGVQWEEAQRDIAAQPDLRLVAVFDDVPVYHDVSLWDWVPGYDREIADEQVYVYELAGEGY